MDEAHIFETLPPPKRQHLTETSYKAVSVPRSPKRNTLNTSQTPQKITPKSPQSRFSITKDTTQAQLNSPESPSRFPNLRTTELPPLMKPLTKPGVIASSIHSLKALSQRVDAFQFGQQLNRLLGHLETLLQNFPECTESDQTELSQIRDDLSRLRTRLVGVRKAEASKETLLQDHVLLEGKVYDQIAGMCDLHLALDLEAKINNKVASFNDGILENLISEVDDQEAKRVVEELKHELNLSNQTISQQREEISALRAQLETQSRTVTELIRTEKVSVEIPGKENQPVTANSPRKGFQEFVKPDLPRGDSPLRNRIKQGQTASLSPQAKQQFRKDVLVTQSNGNTPRPKTSVRRRF